jgi:putative hydrolase of the HAD superfamily
MFKAITFDLWNTLIDGSLDHGANRIDFLHRTCRSAGCFRERRLIESAYRNTGRRLFSQLNSKTTTDNFVQHILEAINVSFTPRIKEQLVKGFEEVILADPPGLLDNARVVLRELHRRVKIGLVCNTGITPGRALRQVLKHHGVLRCFTSLVFSDEVGAVKPDPAIFKAILEGLHASADESVHVGDLLETDVVGAKASGMSAIWINREGNEMSNTGINYTPDFEIKTLSTLLEIL